MLCAEGTLLFAALAVHVRTFCVFGRSIPGAGGRAPMASTLDGRNPAGLMLLEASATANVVPAAIVRGMSGSNVRASTIEPQEHRQ